MDGKKALPYHKSPSRASRVVCETLNSEKLAWLAPVSSPLLSPGREKIQMVRKKVKHRSIFALPRRAKVSIEAEDPSSPKVSCIGQVRTSKKNSFAASKAGKSQHYKPGSESPARFISSPGRQPKWGSLFCSHKDVHCAALASLGPGGGEVSCFGFPRDSSSGYNSKKSCSAFFAQSLLLLQECEGRVECSKSVVGQMHAHAHAHSHSHTHTHSLAPAHAHNDTKEKQIKSIVPIPRKQSAFEQGNTHALRVAIQQKESYANETLTNKHVHEDAEKHAPLALPQQHERTSELCEAENVLVLPFEENQQGLSQNPTCEKLHCGGCNKEDLKISVKVTPETRLCRRGEDSMRDDVNGVCNGALLMNGSSSDHLRQVQGEEASTPSSCDEECLSHGEVSFTLPLCDEKCSLHEATGCCRHEFSSCQSQFNATDSLTSKLRMLEDDITCKGFKSEDSSCIAGNCKC